MSHISRQPLPSIALVLTTDHTRLPRHPSVIKVAPSRPAPTKAYMPQFNPMSTTHFHEDEVQSFYDEKSNSQNQHDQGPHAVFIEEVESLDIAESIYDAHANKDHVGLGKAVKHKISSAMLYIYRLLCVELPQACFCTVIKH